MDKYLEILKFSWPIASSILPIAISIWAIFRTKKANENIVNLKAELARQTERKSKLSENQRAILFIIQNMTANAIIVNDSSNIEEKIEIIMKNKSYDKIFSLELFNNSVFALFNEIALSTCSEKVMAVRLRLQEKAYENKKDEINQYYMMVLYSILYKHLYFDFTGNKIDDLYLLKYNLNDFNKHVTELEKLKGEIYSDLIKKNNWNNLKN